MDKIDLAFECTDVFDGTDVFDDMPISDIQDFKLVNINNLSINQKKEIIILLDVFLSVIYKKEYTIWDIDLYSRYPDKFYSAQNYLWESPFYLAIEWHITDLHTLIEDL